MLGIPVQSGELDAAMIRFALAVEMNNHAG